MAAKRKAATKAANAAKTQAADVAMSDPAREVAGVLERLEENFNQLARLNVDDLTGDALKNAAGSVHMLTKIASNLHEMNRAGGRNLLDSAQCERLRTLRKAIDDRAELVDQRYWEVDQDRLDDVKRACEYFHYTIASVCTGIKRTPEGFNNPLAHELRSLAREDRYSVADVGAALLEAAEVFDTEAKPHAPGSHTDDRRNRVPTDATGRKLYVLLWAILASPEREWFDTSKPRSVAAFGGYAEFDRYKAYSGTGLPHSKKAGLAWPVRLGDGPLDHLNRIWNEAAGEVWRLCMGDVDRDEGRLVLERQARIFGVGGNAAQNSTADAARIPVYKPGGWTKSDIVQHLRDAADSFSPSTFDTIRKRAGVRPAPKGGNGPHHCYSIAELRKFKAEIDKGRYQRKADLSTALDELIERSTSKVGSQSNHKL
jgi:hypothetical protein